jgi:hypothetical protein
MAESKTQRSDDEGLRYAIARAYWEVLSRAPEPEALEEDWRACRKGLPLKSLREGLVRSEEGLSLKQNLESAMWWEGASCRLPYRLSFGPRQRLIVCFAGLSLGAALPSAAVSGLCRSLGHVLAVGVPDEPPRTASAITDWSDAAADLVRQTARNLDVPLTDVISLGHSFAGTRAALVGLSVEHSTVVTGAPALHLGSALERLRSSERQRPSVWPVIEYLHAGAAASSLAARAVLDELAMQKALKSPAREWHLLTGQSDIFYEEAVECARKNSATSVMITLTIADFATHNDVFEPFAAFVRQLLSR